MERDWNVRDAVVVRIAPFEIRMGRIVAKVSDEVFIVAGYTDSLVVHGSRLSDAEGPDRTWIENYVPFMEHRIVVCIDPLPDAT